MAHLYYERLKAKYILQPYNIGVILLCTVLYTAHNSFNLYDRNSFSSTYMFAIAGQTRY